MHKNSLSLIVFIAALASASLSPFAAWAQSPGAIAVAREVILAKGAGAMTQPLVIGVIESAKNTLVPTNPNLQRELNEVAVYLQKELGPRGSNEALDQMARAYAARFTEQELKDLLVFYKTPLGQKVIKDEPMAIEDGLKNAQAWADRFSQVVLARIRTEMQKKGHQL